MKLSPLEARIVSCVCKGERNARIAEQVGLDEDGVKRSLKEIYTKLGVSDRLELALYCLRGGAVECE